MNAHPLAFHITFGTYGTRLHGDDRGTVHRAMNKPGDPIVGADRAWWERERANLNFDPVVLTPAQMRHAESVVPAICERGHWHYHVCAAGPDHVHVLLTATQQDDPDGKAVRKWLKRWLGQGMSDQWPLPDGATWWAEGGSVRWVWTQDYYERVYGYVRDQRATRE